MFRHCEMLHLAGDDSILPGSTVPCMDKKKVACYFFLVNKIVERTSEGISSLDRTAAHAQSQV